MHAEANETVVVDVDHPSLSVDPSALIRLLLHVAEVEGTSIAALNVVLTGHEQVRSLNQTYLQHDYDTDVLSFDLGDGPGQPVDGEIYIDLDTAMERHKEFETSFEHEVFRYAVHGLLHLVGYADDSPEGKAAMRALEDRYLGPGESA